MNSTESIDPNVEEITLGDRTIFLVGTAHVSQRSVELAERSIRELTPDTVAVELCASRFQAMKDPNRWKNTDIVQVIRSGKIYLLLAQIMLAAFQRKLGKELNIRPGAEMLRATAVAEELNIPLLMADREIKTTLRRTWAALSSWQKCKLLFTGPLKVFSDEKIDIAEIERLKRSDVLEEAMRDLATAFPGVQRALIDERDRYLAAKIASAPGQRIVAILGAGHIPGIKRYLSTAIDLTELETLPRPGKLGSILAWGIPSLVVLMIAYGFWVAGAATGTEMIASWIWITGLTAALGALLALSHPLTILIAFVSAPITTLHPFLASGWFAGLTEAILRKPKVSDLESILDDITTVKGFFSNRVSRIILVVAFTNLLGTLGGFIAMGKIAFASQLLQ